MNRESDSMDFRTNGLRVAVTIDSKSTGWELLAPGFVEGENPKVGRV